MSDDEVEQTITAENDADATPRASRPTTRTADTDADRAADSFLSLESDLQGLRGGPDRLFGYAEDAARISAEDVPDGYPITITSEEALRLRVRGAEAAETTADADAVYFEWPPAEDGPLSRLLALRDVDPERFADLNGKRVPLSVESGFLVPRVPPTAPRGSPEGVYGILGGVAATLGLLGLVATGLVSLTSISVVLGLALLSLVVMPISTYVDAWHLLTTTDWEGGPPFWTVLSAIPGVNVLSSAWYLVQRRNADPL